MAKRVKTLPPTLPSAAIEVAYRKKLERLIKAMTRSVLWWTVAAYRRNEKRIMATDSSPADELFEEMQKLRKQWNDRADEVAESTAEWFANKTANYTLSNINANIAKSGIMTPSFGVRFRFMDTAEKGIFQSIVYENVHLIKTIPTQYLDQVETLVQLAIQNGSDLRTLTKELYKRYNITFRRAAMIARDQNAKATEGISRSRLTRLGITEAIWMHTSAGKTYRSTHVKGGWCGGMNGTRFNIAQGCYDPDPKVKRYIHPGELVNCRCVARPIIPEFEMFERKGQ